MDDSDDQVKFDGDKPSEGKFAHFRALPIDGGARDLTTWWEGSVGILTSYDTAPDTLNSPPLNGRVDLLASWIDGELTVLWHDNEIEQHGTLTFRDAALTEKVFSEEDPRNRRDYWYQLLEAVRQGRDL